MAIFDDLTRLPGSPQLHRWADWAELICYTSSDGVLTVASFAATATERKDFRGSECHDDIEPDEPNDELLESEAEPAELNDRFMERAVQTFEYLDARAGAYGGNYPFSCDVDSGVLTLQPGETPNRLLYVFLLACSALRYVDRKSDQTVLASYFEAVALEAARKLLPPRAEVHLFGANGIVASDRYSGKLYEKLTALCADLGWRLMSSLDEFEAEDRGDNGLDIVAWVPFADSGAASLVLFGQCACTPEWVSKQHSTSESAWRTTVHREGSHVNLCFIPHDFRTPDGAWYRKRSVQTDVLIDRRRIMELVADLGSGDRLADSVVEALSRTRLSDARAEALDYL